MEAKRYPITVESFHYDLVKQGTPVKNDLQVAMRQIQWSDPKKQAELKKGNQIGRASCRERVLRLV